MTETTEVLDAAPHPDEPGAEPIPVYDDHHTALERRPPPSREVLMPLDVEQVVQGMQAYQEMLPKLLNDADYQAAEQGKRFVKKSGWRKIARAFNLSTEIISLRIERDENGNPQRAEAVVRAIAPNGLVSDGDGYCDVEEKRFSRSGGRQKIENDLRTTATTRAKNRAISDMVGMGEVSAEEASAEDFAAPAAHPWGEQADQALGEKAFRALAYLMEGDETTAAMVWAKVLADSSPDESRRFFPKAAARTLLHAAVTLRDTRERTGPPESEPEFDPVSQKIAEEEFPAETIDPAHANELLDAIVAKHMTTGGIKALFGQAGITVTAPMLKSKEGLLDITSGLTVPQAGEVERLLKEMDA